MTRSLSADDFGGFYKEVHGRRPFKWQSELAKRVVSKGWPRYLDMPTASGKTSVIDVAVFHLAAEAGKRGRSAPARIAFVVDRRMVVDGAFEHACEIAHALSNPKGEVVRAAAERLKAMSGGAPLKVARLRGAMPQDKDWSRTPSQPLVIVSTVDQVGSRLLFRGYGVSDSMKPVHAGLLGADILYVLDEAHTSRTFMDTLGSVGKMRADGDGQFPFYAMFMSATLGKNGGDVFPTDAKVRKAMTDDMKDRMDARKHVRLLESKSDEDDAFVRCALDLAFPKGEDPEDRPGSVGVVVNRVNRARSIFEKLRSQIPECDPGAEAYLLTGRSRPLERDMILGPKIDGIKPGKTQQGTQFFVSTQAIEVGVDIDLGALVTQVAPVDSLRQRFGRLDRVGDRSVTHGVIIASKTEISKAYKDPIYDDRLRAAWEYLKGIASKRGAKSRGSSAALTDRGTVDFGVNQFPEAGWDDATSPRPRKITLMPAYVRLWCQTRPHPDPDPDPGIFLHGPSQSSADVHVVWRADITEDMMGDERDRYVDQIDACRPSQLEAVSIPIWVADRWMRREMSGADMGDVEGVAGAPMEPVPGGVRRAVRWRGASSPDTRIVTADKISPGDVLVVPATAGGCDRYGWDGGEKEVTDIGMEAGIVNRGVLDMRLGEKYIEHALRRRMGTDASNETENPESAERARQAAKAITDLASRHDDGDPASTIDGLRGIEELPDAWKRAIEELFKIKDFRRVLGNASVNTKDVGGRSEILGVSIRLNPEHARAVLDAVCPEYAKSPLVHESDLGSKPSTDDGGGDAASGGDLLAHSCGVQSFAEEFAKKIGMGEDVASALSLAGLLHDAGKAERRVQAMLRRQDPDDMGELEAGDMLAKSARPTKGYKEYKTFLDRAHLPEGYRHECWSVRLASAHPKIRGSSHADLIKYLIGTHHGHGRPVFPAVDDPHAVGTIRWSAEGHGMEADAAHGLSGVDPDWIDMCEGLYEKYGPWGLAHMEAVLRLADHCQSAKEEKR